MNSNLLNFGAVNFSDDILVSVIVPTYKRTDMLTRALDSLLEQTYPYIEVVLVNDNGKDTIYNYDLSIIVEKYRDMFYKFKYLINEDNKGASKSRNEGVKKAKGSLVTFLDDDDVYSIDKIEKQVSLYRNSEVENLALIYCQIRVLNQETGRIVSENRKFYKGIEEPLQHALSATLAGTPAILVNRDFFLQVGGFRNLVTGEDWCFVLDVLLAGGAIDYNKEFLVNAYVHNEGRISNSNKKLEGRLSENLMIKMEVMDRMSLGKAATNKIYFNHYYSVASMFKYSEKITSFKYILKAFSYGFYPKKLIKFSFGFLFGQKISEYLSRFYRV